MMRTLQIVNNSPDDDNWKLEKAPAAGKLAMFKAMTLP